MALGAGSSQVSGNFGHVFPNDGAIRRLFFVGKRRTMSSKKEDSYQGNGFSLAVSNRKIRFRAKIAP